MCTAHPGFHHCHTEICKKITGKILGQLCAVWEIIFLDNIQGLTTLKVYQSDGYKNEEMNKDAEHFPENYNESFERCS